MVDARVLLLDYNHWRERTAHYQAQSAKHPMRDLGTRHLPAFQRVVDWTVARGLDSRFWMYSLFVRRHWQFAPPTTQLTPQVHLAFYHRLLPGPDYRAWVTVDDSPVQTFELTPLGERVKHQLVATGRAALCRDQASELGGWHAESRVCQTCVESPRCRAQMLKAEVLVYCQGRLTRGHAQEMAEYGTNFWTTADPDAGGRA